MAIKILSSDTPESVQATLGAKGVQTIDHAGNDTTVKDLATEGAKNDAAAIKDAALSDNKDDKTTGDSAASGNDVKDTEDDKLSLKAQKRIDKLTKEVNDLRKAFDATPRKDDNKDVKPAAATVDAEPKPDDYDTQSDYLKALAKWATKEARKEARVEEDKQIQTVERQKIVDNWNTQVTTAKTKYSDWDKVMTDEVVLGDASARALIETPDGAELLYYIAKNPEEAKQFAPLTGRQERQIGIAIGELRAKMKATSTSKDSTAKGSTKDKPKPISPVGGTSTGNVDKKVEDMSYQEYKAKRKKEIAEKQKQSA